MSPEALLRSLCGLTGTHRGIACRCLQVKLPVILNKLVHDKVHSKAALGDLMVFLVDALDSYNMEIDVLKTASDVLGDDFHADSRQLFSAVAGALSSEPICSKSGDPLAPPGAGVGAPGVGCVVVVVAGGMHQKYVATCPLQPRPRGGELAQVRRPSTPTAVAAH